MLRSKKLLFGGGGLILLVCAAVVYYTLDPMQYAIFPKCPFLILTGWQCPGCGSQRAIHSLLHLDVVAAFRYNALMVLSIPLVLLLVYAECCRTRRPRLYARLHRVRFIYFYLAVVVLWCIGRNVAAGW